MIFETWALAKLVSLRSVSLRQLPFLQYIAYAMTIYNISIVFKTYFALETIKHVLPELTHPYSVCTKKDELCFILAHSNDVPEPSRMVMAVLASFGSATLLFGHLFNLTACLSWWELIARMVYKFLNYCF